MLTTKEVFYRYCIFLRVINGGSVSMLLGAMQRRDDCPAPYRRKDGEDEVMLVAAAPVDMPIDRVTQAVRDWMEAQVEYPGLHYEIKAAACSRSSTDNPPESQWLCVHADEHVQVGLPCGAQIAEPERRLRNPFAEIVQATPDGGYGDAPKPRGDHEPPQCPFGADLAERDAGVTCAPEPDDGHVGADDPDAHPPQRR